MSKKLFIAAAFAALAFAQGAKAQTNLQTFYDFGKNRDHFTTTTPSSSLITTTAIRIRQGKSSFPEVATWRLHAA